MTQGPRPDPRTTPVPREAPGDSPRQKDERPRHAPGDPDQPDEAEAPPRPHEPPRPKNEGVGLVGVDAGEAHMGATEEQVGDLTGPGAGYDEGPKR